MLSDLDSNPIQGKQIKSIRPTESKLPHHDLGQNVLSSPISPRIPPRIDHAPSCSVVVPARNESGNIRAALQRIPRLGMGTEIIFVEGNSTDDTWDTIQREVDAYDGPHTVKAVRQPGKGKWDAVFAGFEIAILAELAEKAHGAVFQIGEAAVGRARPVESEELFFWLRA